MTRPLTRGVETSAYRPHQIRMLALACVAFFASARGQSFLISVFVDDFLTDTGVSRTWFSALTRRALSFQPSPCWRWDVSLTVVDYERPGAS